MMLRTLAAVALVGAALVSAAASAAAWPVVAPAVPPAVPPAPAPFNAIVRGLSVRSADERTEVVISIEGNVSYRNMLLDSPSRLVVDFEGAQQGSGLERFDGVNRGGVRNLRVGQFAPNVVRVVIELEGPVRYRLERAAGEVRVSFANPVGAFESWSVSALPAPARGAAPTASRANGSAELAQPVAPQAAAGSVRQQPRPPMSVTFIDQPLSEVLATVGDYARRTIIASQSVRSTIITAEIRQQPWDLALEAILLANGLVAREHPESGIIIVEDAKTVAERVIAEPMAMRQFRIQHVSADSLVRAVEGMLTPTRGKVTVSVTSNTLLITDQPSVLDQIAPIIQQLDVRPVQVTIAATIAFIDRSALEQYGVTYDLKDSQGSAINRMVSAPADPVGNPTDLTNQTVVLLGGNSVAALANANYRVPSPAIELVTSLVLGRHTLITFLEALQTVSLSDIQAKPVVQTTNHQQAVIQVGQSTPIRVLDAGAAGGLPGGTAPQATVDFRETGIILRVTPHVTGDQVRLDMHAERSNALPAPSDIGFVFTTQLANTQVIVRDGETAVIGGLTVTEKSRVHSGIPLLMDLPLIGRLFRNTREEENKRDLLIMVTPHIVH
jgi:type IV pilus assembly protein PilQ